MVMEETNEFIRDLWHNLGNIPVNDEQDEIDEPFHIWPKGTAVLEIWHWFDEQSTYGVANLMKLT